MRPKLEVNRKLLQIKGEVLQGTSTSQLYGVYDQVIVIVPKIPVGVHAKLRREGTQQG